MVFHNQFHLIHPYSPPHNHIENICLYNLCRRHIGRHLGCCRSVYLEMAKERKVW